MRKFADYGELKKAALMVTAFQLDKDEIKQLKVCVFPPVFATDCDQLLVAESRDVKVGFGEVWGSGGGRGATFLFYRRLCESVRLRHASSFK